MNIRQQIVGRLVLAMAAAMVAVAPAAGQEKSVRPGINQPFEKPDVQEFIKRFEAESREPFAKRKEILAACQIKHGMTIADIGAGTGLFTRLLAEAVGPHGKVYAVDIAPAFVEHAVKTCKDKGIANVVGVVCTATSTELPPNSIDLAFICDTYHHFEFPFKTMSSIRQALRPGGRVVLVDFKRIKGESSDWVMNHVRAGQEVVTKEVESTGFRLADEKKLLKENYLLLFEKAEKHVKPNGKDR
jgi:ubiquinone/menaquinone biosynthesis C-methylase UbiE